MYMYIYMCLHVCLTLRRLILLIVMLELHSFHEWMVEIWWDHLAHSLDQVHVHVRACVVCNSICVCELLYMSVHGYMYTCILHHLLYAGMYGPGGMGPGPRGMMMPRPGVPMMGMGRGGYPPMAGPPMDMYYYNPWGEGMGFYGEMVNVVLSTCKMCISTCACTLYVHVRTYIVCVCINHSEL